MIISCPMTKMVIFQGYPRDPPYSEPDMKLLAIWPAMDFRRQEKKEGMVSLQMLHWNMRFIYSKHLVRYWVKCVLCVLKVGILGNVFFFLRGTMSNTEITEMNVKVLHVCVHMYFILLYLIVYIYN